MLKLNKFEQKQYKNEIAKANAAAKHAAKITLPPKRFVKQVKEELPSEAPLDIKARAERLERMASRIAFAVRTSKTLPPGFKHKSTFPLYWISQNNLLSLPLNRKQKLLFMNTLKDIAVLTD